MPEKHPRARMAAHLGLTIEALIAGQVASQAPMGPWERWWVAYRLGRGTQQLGWVTPTTDTGVCDTCHRAAAELCRTNPPAHPDQHHRPCPGQCLLAWAQRVRSGGADPVRPWPGTRLTLAVLKPGAPHTLADELTDHFEVLTRRTQQLAVADVRRMYPEAYGAEYVAARDVYLTSAPVQVLLLHSPEPGVLNPTDLKRALRARHNTDTLRNHLHIADNPGETFVDIAHLLGWRELTDLYDTYEHHDHEARVAHHRAVLGSGAPPVDGFHARSA